MEFLKAAYYTAAGVLMTICYYTGHQTLMNWLFLFWVPILAWDFAQWITPYQDTKKES